MSDLTTKLAARLAFPEQDDGMDFGNEYLREQYAPLHEKLLAVVEAAEAHTEPGCGNECVSLSAADELIAALAELRREVGE